MTNKKELSEEELEDVNGGCDTHVHLPSDHGHKIDKYDAQNHIGIDVYIVCTADPTEWFWGKLVDSYEDNTGWGTTYRTHKIEIKGADSAWATHKNSIGTTKEFKGDQYDLFYKLTKQTNE